MLNDWNGSETDLELYSSWGYKDRGYRPGQLSGRAPEWSCRGPRFDSRSIDMFSMYRYLYAHSFFPITIVSL